MQVIKNKTYYTYRETAELLGIHRDTVKHWALNGDIKVIRLGWRTVRITQDAIDEFMKNREKAEVFEKDKYFQEKGA